MQDIQLSHIDLNLPVLFEALMQEGSVLGAAEKLCKTPSAVSHALQRLREQVGDPLMVKVGGRMQPSPFALNLIEEVRPILRSIKRVLAVPQPFDPATIDRVFRAAMPAFPKVMSSVVNTLQASAPNVKLEWVLPKAAAFPAVVDGQIDLAHLGGKPGYRMVWMRSIRFPSLGRPFCAKIIRRAPIGAWTLGRDDRMYRSISPMPRAAPWTPSWSSPKSGAKSAR